jgi:putative ABC transport system permease protein
MTPFKLAILNLTRRKLPTYIALISIAISVASSGILLRSYILSSSRFSTLAEGWDAIAGAKSSGTGILLNTLNLEGNYPEFVPYNLFESLRREQEASIDAPTPYSNTSLRQVTPFLYFGKYNNYKVIGTDATIFQRNDPAYHMTIKEGRWAENPSEVVLGSKIADKENLNINDDLMIEPWIGNEPTNLPQIRTKISGIIRETNSAWDYAIFSNIETAKNVLHMSDTTQLSIWGAQVLNYFLVNLRPEGYKPFQDLINSRTVAQVVFVEEEKAVLEDLTSTGKNLGIIIIIFILVLGGLCVASMMVTRFDAMSFQLAVLRAIGYEKSELRNWLLWEGILLGITASFIGAVFDFIFFPIIKNMLGSSLPSTEFISSPLYYSSPVWIIAIVSTIIAVWIPLLKIYRQDIHNALRGV